MNVFFCFRFVFAHFNFAADKLFYITYGRKFIIIDLMEIIEFFSLHRNNKKQTNEQPANLPPTHIDKLLIDVECLRHVKMAIFFIESKNNIYRNSPERKKWRKIISIKSTHTHAHTQYRSRWQQVYVFIRARTCMHSNFMYNIFFLSLLFSFMILSATIGATDHIDYSECN